MTLQVVVGGQFGSEAKGAVTAAICADEARGGKPVTVVRVGGPNAGHSAYDPQGRLWALRQVPAGMVVHSSVRGVIADGSEIDLEVLEDEIVRLEAAGHKIRHRLVLSGEATVIDPEHKTQEQSLISAVGSTGKGIGAARANRLLRTASRIADRREAAGLGLHIAAPGEIGDDLNHRVRDWIEVVVVEGTQGYGLGLHAGFYPQCTAGNVRAVDACAQAGINPWGPVSLTVHVVVRPYPIRVAGNSGPLKGETSWDELGLEPELTTVTKKVRRVGEWDRELVAAALTANGPGAKLAVSMIDQIPGYTEAVHSEVGPRRVLTEAGWNWLRSIEEDLHSSVRWYGTGPHVADWRIFE